MDDSNIARFVDAHMRSYQNALTEIRNGRKISHCEQIKRGYVPGAKSANRQKFGYVLDCIFANRRGYDLVVSLTRATSRLCVY